jgi:hypothetical protein
MLREGGHHIVQTGVVVVVVLSRIQNKQKITYIFL